MPDGNFSEGHLVSAAEQRWSSTRNLSDQQVLEQYDAKVSAFKAKCCEALEMANDLKRSSNFGPSLEREGLDMDDCVHLLLVMGHGDYWSAEDAL